MQRYRDSAYAESSRLQSRINDRPMQGAGTENVSEGIASGPPVRLALTLCHRVQRHDEAGRAKLHWNALRHYRLRHRMHTIRPAGAVFPCQQLRVVGSADAQLARVNGTTPEPDIQ
jgi:hypothetical protein